MKIKLKLFTGFSVIIILTIFLGIMAFTNSAQVGDHFEFLVEHDLNVLQNAQKLQKLVVDAETGLRGFVITGDERFLEPYYSGINEFNELIQVEKELVSYNPPQLEKLVIIDKLFKVWIEKSAVPEIELARTAHQSAAGTIDLKILLSQGTGKLIFDNIRFEFNEFIQIENELKDKRFEIVSAIESNTQNSVLGFTIASVTLGILISIYLIRSINKPITKLKEVAGEIAKGNLEVESEPMSDDEIGELAIRFNDMRKSIKKSNEKITTQAKKLEIAYKEQKNIDRLKEEFQSMIAHELKTPLTPIIGYSDALKMEKIMGPLSEKQLKSVNKISSNAQKLKRLISDIFDAEKLDLGRMTFDHTEFSIDELITDVIEDKKFVAENKKIQIIPSFKKGLTLKSDKNRINQVLSNIINNAVDYVPKETGVISLSADQVNESVIFSIKDNGKGIPKDLQKNLFKKFYQIDSSEARTHGGSGLGLTICKGIVENLGGKIWLESEVGKGCKFFISIPKDRKEGKE